MNALTLPPYLCEGDKVVIKETRPISKTKSFVLAEVVEKARGSIELKEEENA